MGFVPVSIPPVDCHLNLRLLEGDVSYNLNLKRYIEFGNMLSLIQVPEQSEVMD